MFTSTTAKPIRLASTAIPLSGPGGVGVPVARILDHRRVRRLRVAVGQRDPIGERGDAGRMRRRVHVDRELGAVARGQVLVAVVGDLLLVDAGIPRRGGVRVDGYRRGLGAAGEPDAISAAGPDLAVDDAAQRIGALADDHVAGRVQQRSVRVRFEPCRVDLLGAAVRIDAYRCCCCCGRAQHEQRRNGGRDC